jgi:uncharacterized protein YoxC
VITPEVLDACIAFSMAFMALSSVLLTAALMGVLWKGRDTLGAVEKLCNTLDSEVAPTAVQLREVMDSVNQLKGVTTQRITAVSHKVEDVAGSVGTAVDKAQRSTTIMGTGLFAGVRAYFAPKGPQDHDKQISMERERDELRR